MDRFEYLARVSVARACGFGSVAILTLMVGLSDRMHVALKAGGYATLLMAAILVLKAWRAGEKPYKRTELWLMLEPTERPRASVAQRVLGGVLRDAFLLFAYRSTAVAVVFLVGSVLLAMIRSGD